MQLRSTFKNNQLYSKSHLYNEMVKENQTPAIACNPCPSTALGWIATWSFSILVPCCCMKGGNCLAKVRREISCTENASVIHRNPKVPREVLILQSASITVSLGIGVTLVIKNAQSAMQVLS